MTNQPKPIQYSILLVALVTISHIILAFFVDLGADEAHYGLYGLMPDWSYFDHPPLVGWLQIIPMWLFPYDWATRIVPITLFVIINFLLYKITVTLYKNQFSPTTIIWLGFWALVLLNSSVMFSLMGFGMLPDSPLIVITLALILIIIKLLKQNKLKYWLFLGLFLGLAALAKYTAITLVVSLILIMLIEKRWHWLKQPGLYLAILIALILITPIFYWNIQHDWASFIYQIDHGTGGYWSLNSILRSQAVQLIVYTPLLFLVGWYMLFKVSNYQQQSSRLLLAFAVPIIILFLWGSGFEETLPHWVALAWLLLIPIVVVFLWGKKDKVWLKPLIIVHLLFNITLVIIVHSLLVTPWLSLADNKNPMAREFGWQQATNIAKKLQKQHSTNIAELPLFVNNWSLASRVAWYARPQPVYIADHKQTQFPFWFGSPHAGMNGLLIMPNYAGQPRTNRAYGFEKCHKLKKIDLKKHGSIVVSYNFYKCTNFQLPITE